MNNNNRKLSNIKSVLGVLKNYKTGPQKIEEKAEQTRAQMEGLKGKEVLTKPYTSQAQARFVHAKAEEGKKWAKGFERHSEGQKIGNLPEHVEKSDDAFNPTQHKEDTGKTEDSSWDRLSLTEADAKKKNERAGTQMSLERVATLLKQRNQKKKEIEESQLPVSELAKANVVMPAKEAVKEHKHLVNVLKTPSHKDDLVEAKKQGKELKEYKELNKAAIPSMEPLKVQKPQSTAISVVKLAKAQSNIQPSVASMSQINKVPPPAPSPKTVAPITPPKVTPSSPTLKKNKPSYKVAGQINGHSYYENNGYPRFSSGPNRGKYVHQVKAEEALGRSLKSNEEVNHKNGERSSFSPKNLQVMTAGAHAAKTNHERSQSSTGHTGEQRYMHSRDYINKADPVKPSISAPPAAPKPATPKPAAPAPKPAAPAPKLPSMKIPPPNPAPTGPEQPLSPMQGKPATMMPAKPQAPVAPNANKMDLSKPIGAVDGINLYLDPNMEHPESRLMTPRHHKEAYIAHTRQADALRDMVNRRVGDVADNSARANLHEKQAKMHLALHQAHSLPDQQGRLEAAQKFQAGTNKKLSDFPVNTEESYQNFKNNEKARLTSKASEIKRLSANKPVR